MSLIRRLLYKTTPTIKVYFERPNALRNVCAEIIDCLSASLNIMHVTEDTCNVKVVFCIIASRAGTDIEATLARLSGDKPTLVFVLHHTFDPEFSVPSSSRYDRFNVMMVDVSCYEDSGLLRSPKNREAFIKAETYLKKYTELQYAVSVRHVLLLAGLATFFVYIYTRKNNTLKKFLL